MGLLPKINELFYGLVKGKINKFCESDMVIIAVWRIAFYRDSQGRKPYDFIEILYIVTY